MREIVYRDGTLVPDEDLDVIFRGFGFHSAQHFELVLAGDQPSALGRRRAASPREAVTPAEFARQTELNRQRHEHRREAARRGRLLALARKAPEVTA
ncbi:hypothetical protein GV794_02165 [Nocardia cyriacigeorgica]|uniref:Uncharacterized protein n=1 Tax=Nocardia cyriacigeorgica TaxID=135487 RepID=A0ABX0CGT3_9NOCA|nr:hypothetical protein [Nocardia cyriacigeorgica]NEW42766.1 hypothetical protein [Nocardia cyriacigeorgica]NEW53939.1 hypothetical protein [Nocardia cyriacigeorgica]NEW54472.1 hypothetical protein [Nocardia cyriacigeorgica]